MRWSERQVAMLGQMGVRLWFPQANAHLDQGCSPLPPAERGEGEAGASPVGIVAAEPMVGSSPAVSSARPAAVDEAVHADMPNAEVALRPRPSGVGAMDWPALREAVAGCTACKLCKGRKQTVFGVGHPSAHWMIVGEAPGEQEDIQGEPFVGKSGQLLDNMLRAIHLTRGEAPPERQVYIANSVKCRPPGNRNPEPDELAQCEPFLIRQVALVRPRIILAMGRFAVQSLLRSSEPIGKLRGTVHRYQGVPLIVTYHPAYLLRNLDDKAKAWDDLCLAVETAGAA